MLYTEYVEVHGKPKSVNGEKKNLSFILKESQCFLTQKELSIFSIPQNVGVLLIQYFNGENEESYVVTVRVPVAISSNFKKHNSRFFN